MSLQDQEQQKQQQNPALLHLAQPANTITQFSSGGWCAFSPLVITLTRLDTYVCTCSRTTPSCTEPTKQGTPTADNGGRLAGVDAIAAAGFTPVRAHDSTIPPRARRGRSTSLAVAAGCGAALSRRARDMTYTSPGMASHHDEQAGSSYCFQKRVSGPI